MKFAFDSSSIFRAIIEDKISVLLGNYTLDLAKYELGNLVWRGESAYERFGKR